MIGYLESGLRPALVGGHWERYPKMWPYALGHKSPDELRALTAAAKVNLCLVRRANRDGHVMRSFEIAALGGCMLAEDIEEHRNLFGSNGECVVYFRSSDEAAARAKELLRDPELRQRLSTALSDRIVNGQHTYRHRLISMLCASDEPFDESTPVAGDLASRSRQ